MRGKCVPNPSEEGRVCRFSERLGRVCHGYDLQGRTPSRGRPTIRESPLLTLRMMGDGFVGSNIYVRHLRVLPQREANCADTNRADILELLFLRKLDHPCECDFPAGSARMKRLQRIWLPTELARQKRLQKVWVGHRACPYEKATRDSVIHRACPYESPPL